MRTLSDVLMTLYGSYLQQLHELGCRVKVQVIQEQEFITCKRGKVGRKTTRKIVLEKLGGVTPEAEEIIRRMQSVFGKKTVEIK
jgi:hypothetical protein